MGSEKTKSAEQEVLEVYQAYINAYLSGDIERMVTDFAEDVVIIGSAGGEIFNNKAEVTQYYKSTANQVAGIVELRNRNLRVQVQGLTALIVEQTDLCVQMDGEWSLYSPFRVTTHLSHKEGQWFIVLQHGSVPDARAGEGEQLNTDDLKAENVRLQEAIKRRTIELEVKNREQEIEASVERVRSKSLAMSQSTEIQQVINTVFEQLGGLGLEMNVASIFIFKEGSKDWEQWVASADTSYSTCFSIPFYDHPIFWDLDKARKAHKAFYTIKYPKKIKDQWFDYAFTHTEYQRIPDQRKAYLLNSEFFLVAFALSAHTGIQLSKYAGDAFTEEDQRILQRFSIVFEQAYTRFLDLQKAETQTREAQIQLALERVRAATMSMFRSEDLGKVAQILFLQMQQLGKGLDRAMIPIVDTRTHSANAWMTTEDGAGVKDGIQVSWLGHPVLNEVYEAWLREEAFIEQDLVGTRLDEFIHWIQANTTTPYSQNQPKRRVYGYARFSYGMIAIIKSTGITTEERNILIRFAKVFEQTYTRFLDLKKAEAQAREAQIETALERVRAHTMAMHQSSELSATAVILFNQLRSLNLMPENIRVFFSLIDTQSDSAEVWMTSKDGHFRPGSHRIPMLNEKELAQIYQLWKDKVPLLIRDLSGKRLEDYHRFLRTLPHVTRDDGFREMLDHPPERFVLTEASHRFGTIGITSFEPLSVEAGNLLVRFSKVFEQTYTRFLDLQKAEIQAREAQIEAALERVRAKTMAMHNSEEVGETIVLLFDELTRLGLEKQARCGIGILDESKFMELWTASLEQEGQVRLNIGRIDMTKHPLLTAGREAWKNDQPDFIYVLEGEDLIRYFSIINDEPDYTYHIDLNNLPGKLIFNEFVFPNGMLYAFTRDPLSEELVRICRRFATVFGQTYRRYKDLIRVEEQAREAQIQLSLERVRASSLAMKQSDELSDTAMLMAQQIRDLGIAAWGCAFHIYADDDEGDYEWFSSEEGHLPFYKTPREKFFLRYYEMRESGETIYIQPFSGEACKAHYEYLLSLPVVGDALGALRDSGTPLPTHQIDHVVFFQHGYLLFITYDPVPQAYDIFRRFAVEFEQAFTRFLDLKKVEEQAREKEIQLALERVRARTMAMQKSDELAEVVQELFRQIRPLDPSAQWGCAILLVDTVREGFHLWFSVPTNPLLPVSVFIHHLDNQVINKCWEEYQKGTDQFRIELKEDEKKSWEDHLFSTTEMGKLPPEMQQAIRAEKYVMFSYASMRFGLLEAISHVPISGELNELLPRFAKVFEQTYTRFQDLQKAEAQAREAHIEAALERVRSRSMAMHKSKDLSEVVKLLYKETEAFGISTFGISIAIFQEEDHSAEYWFADNLNSNLLRSYKVPGPGHPVFQQIWKDWKLHLLQNNIYLEGSEKSDYDDWILGETEFSKLPAELKQEIKSHDTVCFTFTYFKYGYFESVDLSVPPEDSAKILIRFSKVFEQTYTRFLDLQKAEAQAREAQIEAALEKVRSRTIGMRHSDELAEAASLLFREVQALGIPVWSCGYNILSADQLSCTSIMSAEGGLQEPLEIPLTEHESFLPWRNAILNKDDFLVYRMEGEDLEAHYRYMQTLPGFKEFERSGIELPACQINHLVRFNQGFLLFIASVEIPSAYDIFKRFGVVFKQTYTRFLDLQKAEAQARESEIQLALERVRARTMAMHHSLDLRDVVFVLFQQVNGLNIADLGCNINLFYPENRIIETWLAGTDQEPIPKSYFIQVDHPYLTQMWSSWENQDAPFLIYSTGASHESYKNLILETCYQDMPDEFKAYVRENPEAYLVHFNMLCGQIQAVSSKTLSEESISVLQRFAAVFQQSYTRFLDLKNAEAQTREAEIQLALERVRARTMAMHQSDELRSVIHTIFEQLKALGFDA
ncbi:MAG TPA: nuclear transport factor 2 family protein, partial [Saprospiraceae bacterium]|nr:nuclear transport factor 2 family protein [Saprospiraceae bacterium]